MGLFKIIADELLNEEFEKDGGFYVYHGTSPTAEEGISKLGFERFFTGSRGGNMYGAGIYSTYKLSTQGQNARGVYGNMMFKLKVKSLKDFIIYDPDIAVKVYGTPSVEFQLKKILSPNSFEKIKKDYYYPKYINTNGTLTTSTCALALCEYLRYNDPEATYKINGFIFSGNHDGWVCFIKDFKNAYPVEISNDCGKTWRPFEGSKTLQEFGIDDVDLRWQLGKHNYQLMKELDEVPYYFINGFAKVKKNGKFNFLYRKKPLAQGVISPVWFDYAPDTFSKQGRANVVVDGETFIIKLDQKTNTFYVYYADGKYLCRLDSFKIFLENVKSQVEDDDDEDF